MAELFATGAIADVILALIAVEAATLIVFWRVTKRGVVPADLLPNLFAGGFLVLAVRFALVDAGWTASAMCLAAAGLAHVVDIWRRWRN